MREGGREGRKREQKKLQTQLHTRHIRTSRVKSIALLCTLLHCVVLYLFYEEGQRRHFVQQPQLTPGTLGVCIAQTRTHTQRERGRQYS